MVPRSPIASGVTAVVTVLAGLSTAGAQDLTLPLAAGSVRFAVIGDSGTGGREQHEVGERMAEYRAKFPFEFVLMLGDNIYGRERPEDYLQKFERPYAALLDAGVKFYASLGNHDEPNQRFYEPFNMNGERYYSFAALRGSVRFFALESGYIDDAQLEWIERALVEADEDWKIGFFHHPLYSSGRRHGPAEEIREFLEPLFIEHGVDVVFSGHEHFYERLKPQSGIFYFTSGGPGSCGSRISRARRPNMPGGSTRTIASCWSRSWTTNSTSRRSPAPATLSTPASCHARQTPSSPSSVEIVRVDLGPRGPQTLHPLGLHRRHSLLNL